jgi:type IV pilus assembly protein PilA
MEIVVVVGIVALLAAMAVPSITNSIVRRQIVDAVPLADFVKKAIADAWTGAETLPADNGAAGLPPPSKIVNNYVSSVRVKDGAIHLTFGNNVHGTIAGKILTLRPAVVLDTPIVPPAWVCAHAAVPGGMTVQGEDLTNLPISVLPYNCTK